VDRTRTIDRKTGGDPRKSKKARTENRQKNDPSNVRSTGENAVVRVIVEQNLWAKGVSRKMLGRRVMEVGKLA